MSRRLTLPLAFHLENKNIDNDEVLIAIAAKSGKCVLKRSIWIFPFFALRC